MKRSLLLILIGCHFSSAEKTCPTSNLEIASLKYEYGGIDAWLNIGDDMARGLFGKPSKELCKEVGQMLVKAAPPPPPVAPLIGLPTVAVPRLQNVPVANNIPTARKIPSLPAAPPLPQAVPISDNGLQGNIDFKELAMLFVRDNKGGIAFAVCGIILAILSLILCFVVCCIRKSGAKKEQKPGSKLWLFISIAIVSVCIIFVFTGFMIYGEAISQVANSVENEVVENTLTVLEEASQFVNATSSEIMCRVNNFLANTFDHIRKIVNEDLRKFYDDVYMAIGYFDLNDANPNVFKEDLEKMRAELEKVQTQLEALSTDEGMGTSMSLAEQEIHKIRMTIKAISEMEAKLSSDNPEDAKVSHQNILTKMDEVKNQKDMEFDKIVSDSINAANKMESDISYGIRTMTVVFGRLQGSMTRAKPNIKKKFSAALEEYNISVIKTTSTLVGVLPTLIAFGFMCIAVVGSIVSLFCCSSKHPDKRGKLLGAFGCLTVVGVYATLVLAFIAFLLAVVFFMTGSVSSAICNSLFDDPDHILLKEVGFPVTNHKNEQIQLIIGNVLEKCPTSTVFHALEGSKLLNKDSFMKEINFDNIINLVNKKIDSVQLNENDVLSNEFDGLEKSLQTVKAANDLLDIPETILKDVDPSTLGENTGNKVKETKKDFESARNIFISLKGRIDKYKETIANVKAKLINSKLKDEMKKKVSDSLKILKTYLTSNVDRIMTELDTKMAMCAPFMKIYDNAGSILCDGIGRRANGIWTAIGLAAICMLVAPFFMNYMTKWLFNQKPDRSASIRRDTQDANSTRDEKGGEAKKSTRNENSNSMR